MTGAWDGTISYIPIRRRRFQYFEECAGGPPHDRRQKRRSREHRVTLQLGRVVCADERRGGAFRKCRPQGDLLLPLLVAAGFLIALGRLIESRGRLFGERRRHTRWEARPSRL